MKRLISYILIFSLVLSFTSCFEKDLPLEEVTEIPKNDSEDIVADIEQTPSPEAVIKDVSVDELFSEDISAQTPEEAVAFLGADLMKRLYKDDENVFISPLSISLALGLTAGGSNGDTLSQLESVVGSGLSFHDMRDFYYLLSEKLDENENVDIDLANSLWVNKIIGAYPKESYLQFADKYFDAQVFNEDFDSNALDKINSWINEQTDGMIPWLLEEIPSDVAMYIINTLSFDAEWQNEYNVHAIDDSFVFTDSNGNEKTVTAMRSGENVYLEDENAVGFVKNYKGGDYGFAVLLPNEGVSISDYVNTLTGEQLMSILNNKQTAKVMAKFPKFKIEYNTSLKAPLVALGIEDAFDPNKADFSELTDSDVYVSEVLHKTYIEVAEKGTRAAAVTSVEMPKSAAITLIPDETKFITVDRPFVFAIIDNSTNLPLFMGVVQNI